LATAPQPRPARGKRLLPRLRGRSPLTRTARGPRASRLAELVLPSVLRQRPWHSRAPSRSHRPSGQHRLAPALGTRCSSRRATPLLRFRDVLGVLFRSLLRRDRAFQGGRRKASSRVSCPACQAIDLRA
jgi:hypothetical protein